MLRLYEGLVGGVATVSKVKKGGRRW
jgi:hypothetical protein